MKRRKKFKKSLNNNIIIPVAAGFLALVIIATALIFPQLRKNEPKYEKADYARTFSGTSEHNTGLGFDILQKGSYYLTSQFENTAQFKWLMENAEDYGFILRYQKDKIDITGIMYEPWHFRYVGVEHAKRINELGFCLEEYIEYLEA